MVNKYLSTSREDTQELAKKLVSDLKIGTTICLYGELASGKTTFTQGIANFFGITRLTSPTFTIMKEYPVSNHQVIKKICHLDLYRLSDPNDLKAFSVDEIVSDQENLVIIEWPEKFINQMPDTRIDIKLHILSENEREITIQKNK